MVILWKWKAKLFRVNGHAPLPTARLPNGRKRLAAIFIFTVADENEAIEIAKQCPGLEYGLVVESVPSPRFVRLGNAPRNILSGSWPAPPRK